MSLIDYVILKYFELVIKGIIDYCVYLKFFMFFEILLLLEDVLLVILNVKNWFI